MSRLFRGGLSLALLFAAMTLLLPLTARAAAALLVNDTGHWIYLDNHTNAPVGLKYVGLIAPDGSTFLDNRTHFPLFGNLTVYVKSRRSEKEADTMCTTVKHVGVAPYHKATFTVHFEDNKCWIGQK